MAQRAPVTAAKCYRLLRTILATAVEDGQLSVNPCTIKRAGLERSPERKIPTLEQVDLLAAALPERYRALIYTAAFAGLRFGECSALTRERIDLVDRTIAVTEQAHRVSGHGRIIGLPKSEAGKRTVAIPGALVAVLDDHLARFVGPEPTALVFVGEHGAPLERSNWSNRFAGARKAAGLDATRFHDLRHLAGTMAARTGATTRELMARLGHSSPRAALIYQHATAERDHLIAAGLDVLIAEGSTVASRPHASGRRMETARIER
jgi:integrase